MSVDFIAQPQASFRIGDFLKQSFGEPSWTEFRAAVAFVKRSGTKHIRDPLEAFSKRGGVVKISAGIDAGGTSAEGLTDLLRAVGDRGNVFVFKNANSSTFHPKIYLFKNKRAAEIIVGSGNLTEGGLFTNYEASFLMRLDLAKSGHSKLLSTVVQALDSWSTPTKGLCYLLDAAFLEKLVLKGHVPDEVQAWGDEKVATEDQKTRDPGIFVRHSVRSAPKAPKSAAGAGGEDLEVEDGREANEGPVVVMPPTVRGRDGTHSVFLMTLQNTDVGVGQTTKGTSRRSPEIFIPLISRDYDPKFWGWPDLFVADPNWAGPIDGDGRGKMDRTGVMVRLGGATVPVNMWYNPDKRDLRLRSEQMRSAGAVGDILYVERSDKKSGFAYYVNVIPLTSAQHSAYLARCTEAVRNSKKRWGYL